MTIFCGCPSDLSCRGCGLIVLRPVLSWEFLEKRYANARLIEGGNFEQALDAARNDIATHERDNLH